MDVSISERTSSFLDISRGICVTLVLLGHFRSFLFVDYSKIPSSDVITKIFYVLTSFGHYGVIIFFVISGYLCGGRYIYSRSQFCINRYIINRVSRIYSVLIPAILICFVLDLLGIKLNIDEYYGNVNEISSISYSILGSLDLYNFISTIFLVNKHDYIFGSNTPLWSLSYEMYFYLLFAIIFSVVAKKEIRKVHAIVLLPILYIIDVDFLFYFAIWCLGTLIPYLSSKTKSVEAFSKYYWIISWGCLLLLMLTLKVINFHSFINDIIIAFLFSVILVFSRGEIVFNCFFSKNLEKLGKYSFSLYITHFPVGFILIGIYREIISNEEKLLFAYDSLFIYTSVSLIAIGFSCIFYHVFEARSNNLKSYINRTIS